MVGLSSVHPALAPIHPGGRHEAPTVHQAPQWTSGTQSPSLPQLSLLQRRQTAGQNDTCVRGRPGWQAVCRARCKTWRGALVQEFQGGDSRPLNGGRGPGRHDYRLLSDRIGSTPRRRPCLGPGPAPAVTTQCAYTVLRISGAVHGPTPPCLPPSHGALCPRRTRPLRFLKPGNFPKPLPAIHTH